MQKSRDIWKNREKELVWIENCPFCDLSSQWDCVIWKGQYWYIQHNMYPYLWLKENIMAIPYSHKTFTYELSSEELLEFRNKIDSNLREKYGLKGFARAEKDIMHSMGQS